MRLPFAFNSTRMTIRILNRTVHLQLMVPSRPLMRLHRCNKNKISKVNYVFTK